jgi:hypothetical protein
MTTQIVDNRELALPIGYKATEFNFPLTYERYLEIADDWDVKAIVRDDKTIGAIFSKSGEVHVSILPEWRRKWLTKGLLRQIIDRPDFFTQVDDGHDYMYDILARLGMQSRPDGTVGRI